MTPRVSLAWRIIPGVPVPLSQILFFTFPGTFATGRDTASFYAIGNAIQLTAMSGIYGVTMSVGGERNEEPAARSVIAVAPRLRNGTGHGRIC